jgi:hypothetical protein
VLKTDLEPLRDRATMFYLATKAFPHDFGTYREVCAMYDEDDAAGMELAYWLESNTPETWDEEGRRALVSALAEHGYEFTDKGYRRGNSSRLTQSFHFSCLSRFFLP